MGSQKLVEMIGDLLAHRSSRTRLDLIGELSETMLLTSICGLGQVASNPIATVLKHFRGEVDKYLSNGR
jgi:NADH:ubiquinone oxidoreductase subunit F (NADH-binding)